MGHHLVAFATLHIAHFIICYIPNFMLTDAIPTFHVDDACFSICVIIKSPTLIWRLKIGYINRTLLIFIPSDKNEQFAEMAHLLLVGGIPIPLKNDGVLQLG